MQHTSEADSNLTLAAGLFCATALVGFLILVLPIFMNRILDARSKPPPATIAAQVNSSIVPTRIKIGLKLPRAQPPPPELMVNQSK
jgi:hypothetical protein